MNLSNKSSNIANRGGVRVWPPRETPNLVAENTEEIKKELAIMSKFPGTVIGAVAGSLFGMFTIFYGFGAAMILLLFASLGAAIGWFVQSHAKGQLDVSSAWKALNRD